MVKVSDIMTRDPVTVTAETSLLDAIRLMKKHGCRQLPVLRGEHLIGIVTDRDVRLVMNSPFVLHDRSDDDAILKNTTAQDCMTADPLTIDADEPATLAADLMKTYKFGGLPVMKSGKLVGIITVSDILSSYIAIVSAANQETP